MSSRRLNALVLAACAALALAGCSKPAPVRPALWLVEGQGGQKAWLFGTIHALPAPVTWKSAKVAAALNQSDRLVLEVAAINDDAAVARSFAALAESPGQPPLAARIPADQRDELRAALKQDGFAADALDRYESWAAALMLQNAAMAAGDADSANGIDRALAQGYAKPVEEFEGAAAQLAIFDRLPETAQRALLVATLGEERNGTSKTRELEQAWAKGDLAAVDAETSAGFENNPDLRAALLTERNEAWLGKLTRQMSGGARPFVAVGLAHLVGHQGLPALLGALGYRVTRLQ